MAFLEFTYRSEIMKQDITFNALLPDNITDGTYKTLYLYHGLKNDRSSWMRKSSIERYAQKYGIAVIMPGVEHIYEEGEGDHTWPYWDLHIQSALANLLT